MRQKSTSTLRNVDLDIEPKNGKLYISIYEETGELNPREVTVNYIQNEVEREEIYPHSLSESGTEMIDVNCEIVNYETFSIVAIKP